MFEYIWVFLKINNATLGMPKMVGHTTAYQLEPHHICHITWFLSARIPSGHFNAHKI